MLTVQFCEQFLSTVGQFHALIQYPDALTATTAKAVSFYISKMHDITYCNDYCNIHNCICVLLDILRRSFSHAKNNNNKKLIAIFRHLMGRISTTAVALFELTFPSLVTSL